MIDDNDYWNNFYKTNGVVNKPSLFAQYVEENHFEPGKTLLELGCGNGRDAIFFAEKGKRVSALDLSAQTIQRANISLSLPQVSACGNCS